MVRKFVEKFLSWSFLSVLIENNALFRTNRQYYIHLAQEKRVRKVKYNTILTSDA